MNREKKEEKRKHDKARKGLSEDEVLALDLEDEINKQTKSSSENWAKTWY